MEDGHRIVDPLPLRGRDASECWGFFAVYDGHGGRTEVDYCEAKLHEVVLAELRSQTSNGDARAALSSAFEKVDGQLQCWERGIVDVLQQLLSHTGKVLRQRFT